jgi:hypothetical protein
MMQNLKGSSCTVQKARLCVEPLKQDSGVKFLCESDSCFCCQFLEAAAENHSFLWKRRRRRNEGRGV